jgi:hypothetical protein
VEDGKQQREAAVYKNRTQRAVTDLRRDLRRLTKTYRATHKEDRPLLAKRNTRENLKIVRRVERTRRMRNVNLIHQQF